MDKINSQYGYYNYPYTIKQNKVGQKPQTQYKSDNDKSNEQNSASLMLSLEALQALAKFGVKDLTSINTSDANNNTNYKLTTEALEKGSKYLAKEGTSEYNALNRLMKENFVCIPDKESIIEIFKKQHSSLINNSNKNVYILNPTDPVKSQSKNIGTSNAYMSDWYCEANNIINTILTRENIQEQINNSKDDNITIIVPDDCAITGRSMIMDTIQTLNNTDIPKGKKINIVFSPTVASSTAVKAFKAMQNNDYDELIQTKIFNERDIKHIEDFFEKYQEPEIHIAENIIETKPYYESEYFINLKKNDPATAEKVEDIITRNGTGKGFGRPGTSGVMIATPKDDGTLKCPNNNVYGAVPYALAMGATPDTIKQPGKNLDGEKISPAKWRHILKSIQQEINAQ